MLKGFLKPNFDRDDIVERLDIVESEIIKLKAHDSNCDLQHAEHNRRHSDSIKIQSAIDETLRAILAEMKEIRGFVPSMQRTKNKYLVIDTVKGWFLYVGAISAGVTPIFAAYHFIFKAG